MAHKRKEEMLEFIRFLVHEHVINQYISNYKKRGNAFRINGYPHNILYHNDSLTEFFSDVKMKRQVIYILI